MAFNDIPSITGLECSATPLKRRLLAGAVTLRYTTVITLSPTRCARGCCRLYGGGITSWRPAAYGGERLRAWLFVLSFILERVLYDDCWRTAVTYLPLAYGAP